MPKHIHVSTHSCHFKKKKLSLYPIRTLMPWGNPADFQQKPTWWTAASAFQFRQHLLWKTSKSLSLRGLGRNCTSSQMKCLQRIQHHCQFPPRASQRLNLKEFDTAFFTLISWSLWNGTALSTSYEVYSVECRLQRRWSLHSHIAVS